MMHPAIWIRKCEGQGMKFEDVFELWKMYKFKTVNMNVHPKDVMYNTAQVKPWHYMMVGELGLSVILSALSLGPTKKVESIMDFGCGHGRVARYLRACFPEAKMTFAEVDQVAAEFCASEFNGTALVTSKDFTKLTFPNVYDLIWLGSVFTHMDYERMGILFDALFDRLNPAGMLIATFRGHKMYETCLRTPEIAVRDAELIREYEATGVAYKKYPGWEDDWGLSLVSPKKLIALGDRRKCARLVTYSEVAWADAHDVGGWTNVSPNTIIR